MKLISLHAIYRKAEAMPESYLQDVLAAGEVQGPNLAVPDESFAALQSKYRDAVPLVSSSPTMGEMLANFGVATAKWSKAGFPVVSEADFRARQAQCQVCPHFLPNGVIQACGLCGCGELKLHWATESCPAGRWPALSKEGHLNAFARLLQWAGKKR